MWSKLHNVTPRLREEKIFEKWKRKSIYTYIYIYICIYIYIYNDIYELPELLCLSPD